LRRPAKFTSHHEPTSIVAARNRTGESICEICQNAYGDRLTRRSALTFTASALAAGLIGRPTMAAKDNTPPKPKMSFHPMFYELRTGKVQLLS
jgi:hypothetical protein